MRILILRDRGGWGDAVCCQAAVAGLREKYPDARIDWVLPPDLHGLFKYDPIGVKFIPAPKRTREFTSHRTYNLADYGLDPADYDQVVDLWCPAWRYESSCKVDVRLSRIENFCAEAGVPPRRPVLYPGEAELAWARRYIAGKCRPFVLIAWASGNVAKDYPRPQWAEVARELLARGASVTFVGVNLFPPGVMGSESLMSVPAAKLVALSSVADLILALDSGVGHIAAALGRPALWLFGPTNPVSTLRFYPGSIFMWRPDGMPCSPPCYYSAKRRFRCRGRHGDCLAAVPPESVVLVAERMLDWEAAAAANVRVEGDDALYRHYLTLNGVGVDYRAYGAWQTAYAEMLDRIVGIRGKSVADIGAACGAHVKGFLARGADAWGCEPDRWMARHPVAGIGRRLRQATAEGAQFIPGSFDLVHSHMVLEHVAAERVPAHLAALHRALKPGGLFFAVVATDATGGVRLDKTHLTIEPLAWWISQCEAAGFEDVSDEFRGRVEAQPMWRQYRWEWFILRKPPLDPDSVATPGVAGATIPRKEAISA